ncbi:arrestin domain-containing protein 3-like [Corticium candelabrum]|uniref:arrestin domain-containing protein 3-like n=1 Tax=Corticium candelabrum TaxID=121492 RepID=UPI002E25E46A|nr:arrestin domain-containing protein 3-like [Corticium candelabrum]
MTALAQFYVVYKNNRRFYFPGQALCGHLYLEVVEPLAATKIDVVVRGMAKVRWSEQAGQNRVKYKNMETLVDDTVTVWSKTENTPHLQAGEHSFPFSFNLPAGLPSSFELFGVGVTFIRYWVMATVDLDPTGRVKYKRPFTVIQHIDVNDPVLSIPMRSENDKTLCCLCCKSGPLSLSASIDRTGYCPGDTIRVSALAENLTRRVMTGIRAQLISFTIRKENGSATRAGDGGVRILLSEVMGDPIEVGASDKWENRPMTIPACSPSIEGCSFIRHLHYVQVCVVVARGLNLRVHFPIILGTIPLCETVQHVDQHAMYVDNKAIGVFALPQPMSLPEATFVLPVTCPLVEADATRFTVNIAEDDDDGTMGDLNYCPVVPYSKARPLNR